MQSYWQNGNVDERREIVRIRARRGVVLACGGHAGNPQVRSMFHPGLREPMFPTSAIATLGPRVQDASALKAGLKVGANLAGMQQNLILSLTYHVSTRLGTRDAYIPMMPGHPAFGFRGSCGISVGGAGFEEFIAVNQVGKRFFNEVRLIARTGGNRYPGRRHHAGQRARPQAEGLAQLQPRVAPDHLRLRPRHRGRARDQRRLDGAELLLGTALGDLRPGHRRPHGLEAALPVRRGQRLLLQSRHARRARRQDRKGQRVPARAAEPSEENGETWNGYVAAGKDPEFEREKDGAMHPIATGALLRAVDHDRLARLLRRPARERPPARHRHAGRGDPGLFAGGEAAGGFDKHGLGKGTVQGFIAGTNVAAESGS